MKKSLLLILFLLLGLSPTLFADQCYSAYTPTLSSSAGTTICSGSSTILSATGTLNNNANWAWYSGGCPGTSGNTSAGTGTPIVVTPNVTTTYYCRGEGGCADPGPCGQITINVTPSAAAPLGTGASQCGAGSLVLSATVVNTGGSVATVDWYGSATGSSVLAGGFGTTSFSTPFIDTTTTYYAQTRIITGGCGSSTRTPVTATITGVATASSNSPQCTGSTLNLFSNGASTSYSWMGPNGFTSSQQNPVISTITSAATGIYTVTETTVCGSATATVAVNPTPTITSFSPATGPVGTLVTIIGTNLNNPVVFTIGGATAVVVSNTGTQLVGMVMPGAVTGIVSVNLGGCTVPATSAGNFIVTRTPYPGIQQGTKLVGTGSIGSAGQGVAASVSADGNTAIVGGPGDNNQTGAAWVYSRSSGVWSQQGSKLVGGGAVSGPGVTGQGAAVSISADGNTAIVGAAGDYGNVGAAWIYTRSDGVWTQQGNKLVGTVGVTGTAVNRAYQGESVSISADGNTAIVGGPGDSSNVGAAWVYTRSGGIWTQQGSKLVGTGGYGFSLQGLSASISADGNTAIVGGYSDYFSIEAAWVYTRSGGVWTQQGSRLLGSPATSSALQGQSVSISADGNTAIMGGAFDNFDTGAVWVFTRTGGVWTQQGSKLVGTGAAGSANQGQAVSISADGNSVVVGGWADNATAGAVWVYKRFGGVWTQQGNKLLGTGAAGATGTRQGMSVSISADGTTSIEGGDGDNGGAGAAWVFISAPIITGAISPAAYCAGNSVSVSYTSNSVYNADNIFTAQLSDSGGSFTTPTTIGTLVSTTTGTISATIPDSIPAGSGYRIRVVSSDTALTGSDNGSNITVNAMLPIAAASGNSPICSSSTLNLESSGGTSYSWSGPNGFSSSIQNPTISIASIAAGGTYSVVISNACGSTSKSISVIVNPSPTSSTSATACNSYTWNGATFTASGTYTYDAGNVGSPFDCDSIATLVLTISHSSTSSTSVAPCNNNNIYVWNGTTYNSSGTYTYDAGSTSNAAGCDSVATLNLTISNSCQTYTALITGDSVVDCNNVYFTIWIKSATGINFRTFQGDVWISNAFINNGGSLTGVSVSWVAGTSDIGAIFNTSQIVTPIGGGTPPGTGGDTSVIRLNTLSETCPGTLISNTYVRVGQIKIIRPGSGCWGCTNILNKFGWYTGDNLGNKTTFSINEWSTPCGSGTNFTLPILNGTYLTNLNNQTPVITAQPVSTSACANAGSATFSVTAVSVNPGDAAPTYQWYDNAAPSTPLTNTAPYSGVTTSDLTITNPDMSLNGQSYFVVASQCNSATSNSATLTVTNQCTAILSLKLFIQGYYQSFGSGTPMDNLGHGGCLYASGICLNPTDVDTITISLMDPTSQSNGGSSVKAILHTDGSVWQNGSPGVPFPGSVIGNSYYIKVTHRNAIETWSAVPVLFSSNTSYDFSTGIGQAYGGNMVKVDRIAGHDVYAFWSGDVFDDNNNIPYAQDGVIESSDYGLIEEDYTAIFFGYYNTDVTGDGVVESSDYGLIEENYTLVIFKTTPW